MKNFTIALIKPDAVRGKNAGHILVEMEKYYDIVEVHTAHWPRSFAEAFYSEHGGRPYFEGLVEFMSSSSLYMVILSGDEGGEDVVQRWRRLIGSTDPMKAEEHTIRRRFSSRDGVMMHNAVHGSDSPASAERELWLIRSKLYARGREVSGTGGILPDFGSTLLM